MRHLVGPAHRFGAGGTGAGQRHWFLELRACARRASERSRAIRCRFSIRRAKSSMFFLLLAPFAFAPLAIGRWLLLGSAACCRDRLHAAVELRTEPNRLALRRAALRGDGYRGGIRRGALRSFSAIHDPLGTGRDAAFQRHGAAAGRWPFIVDWSAYARAVVLRESGRTAAACRAATKAFGRSRRRTQTSASIRMPIRISRDVLRTTRTRAAFLASIAGRRPAYVCGGVPVSH